MTRPAPPTLGWTIAFGAVAALVVMAALPPVVGGDVGAVLQHAFSAVCHQIPERSPHLAGGPVALCHRCSGILVGLGAGLALAPAAGSVRLAAVTRGAEPLWLLVAAVPTALDWSLGALGVWANTPASRALTGAAFGLAAGIVLAANLLTPRVARAPSPLLSDA